MKTASVIISLALLLIEGEAAFNSPSSSAACMRTNTELKMAPRYDKSTEKWFPTKPEEEKDAAYGPIGSLIRAGPMPFIQHLVFADNYEQAVLKYMAQDGCSRKEAQGNMDAYIENPNDWTYQKLQERQGKLSKFDYANANTSPKQLALSGAWSIVVIGFFGTFIADCIAGKYATP